ncbi:MAG: hypothetical protein E5X77_10160 [Mesorhizobium sp.]|nr:MAG: hypothetical protein E5X77_10160 [Mesorhizobium sp.]
MGNDLTVEQERAFNEWRILAARAAETKDLADAAASGRAFGRFHFLFVEEGLRPSPGKLLPFRRPGGSAA